MIAAINHKRAIQINLSTFLTFSSATEKNWPLSRDYFGSRGPLRTCVSGCCRCGEVAVHGGSTVISLSIHAASYLKSF